MSGEIRTMPTNIQDAWEAAIPVAKSVARQLSSRYKLCTFEDAQQEMLSRFPEVHETIKHSTSYAKDLARAFRNIGRNMSSWNDPLGLGIGPAVRGRMGTYPGLIGVDVNDGDTPGTLLRLNRVENHECFWCGDFFEQRENTNGGRAILCSRLCESNLYNAKKTYKRFFQPILDRLNEGEAPARELKAITPSYDSVIKHLIRLGYQIEITERKQRRHFRLVSKGVPLPTCAA